MSRHRLETYLDKVFGFSALVGVLPEGREFPQHPWKKVFDAVFLGGRQATIPQRAFLSGRTN